MSALIGDIVFGYNLHSTEFVSCKKFEEEEALIQQLEQTSLTGVIRGSGPSSHIAAFGFTIEEDVSIVDQLALSHYMNRAELSSYMSKVAIEVMKLPDDFRSLFQSQFFGLPELFLMRKH